MLFHQAACNAGTGWYSLPRPRPAAQPSRTSPACPPAQALLSSAPHPAPCTRPAGLYGRAAPSTVANFLRLVAGGSLVGTTFSRVLPGQYIMAGKQGARRMGQVAPPEELQVGRRRAKGGGGGGGRQRCAGGARGRGGDGGGGVAKAVWSTGGAGRKVRGGGGGVRGRPALCRPRIVRKASCLLHPSRPPLPPRSPPSRPVSPHPPTHIRLSQGNQDTLAPSAFRLPHLRPGTVSLALGENDDDTNVQQRPAYTCTAFLITTGPGPVPRLDGSNIVFGRVLDGMTTVAEAAAVPTFRPSPVRGARGCQPAGASHAATARIYWARASCTE